MNNSFGMKKERKHSSSKSFKLIMIVHTHVHSSYRTIESYKVFFFFFFTWSTAIKQIILYKKSNHSFFLLLTSIDINMIRTTCKCSLEIMTQIWSKVSPHKQNVHPQKHTYMNTQKHIHIHTSYPKTKLFKSSCTLKKITTHTHTHTFLPHPQHNHPSTLSLSENLRVPLPSFSREPVINKVISPCSTTDEACMPASLTPLPFLSLFLYLSFTFSLPPLTFSRESVIDRVMSPWSTTAEACMLLMVEDSKEEVAMTPPAVVPGRTDIVDSDMAGTATGSAINAFTTAALKMSHRFSVMDARTDTVEEKTLKTKRRRWSSSRKTINCTFFKSKFGTVHCKFISQHTHVQKRNNIRNMHGQHKH